MQVTEFESSTVGDRIVNALVQIGRAAKRSDEFGYSGPGWLMQLLHAHGEQRLTDVAQKAGLDVSTVSRQVRQLIDEGMVTCKSDPLDGRAKLFTLTEQGDARLREAKRQRRRVLTARLAAWSTEDIATLEQLMSRLADEVTASQNGTTTQDSTQEDNDDNFDKAAKHD